MLITWEYKSQRSVFIGFVPFGYAAYPSCAKHRQAFPKKAIHLLFSCIVWCLLSEMLLIGRIIACIFDILETYWHLLYCYKIKGQSKYQIFTKTWEADITVFLKGEYNAPVGHQNFDFLSWESTNPLQRLAQINCIIRKVTKAFQVNNLGQVSCLELAFLFYCITSFSPATVTACQTSYHPNSEQPLKRDLVRNLYTSYAVTLLNILSTVLHNK